MNYFANAGQILIEFAFGILVGLIVLRVLLQLVRANFHNPICQFLYKASNPILMPLRRFIPSWRRLDLAGVLLLGRGHDGVEVRRVGAPRVHEPRGLGRLRVGRADLVHGVDEGVDPLLHRHPRRRPRREVLVGVRHRDLVHVLAGRGAELVHLLLPRRQRHGVAVRAAVGASAARCGEHEREHRHRSEAAGVARAGGAPDVAWAVGGSGRSHGRQSTGAPGGPGADRPPPPRGPWRPNPVACRRPAPGRATCVRIRRSR
ncbi:MAG TPA: YggT family protein [Dokdonella sp.]|nr:YggT family protein [Dokdonella sp.]